MRFVFCLLRMVIFVASIIMTLAVCAFSIASVAVWLFLTFGAHDIGIHGLRGELLSRLNGLVFRQSDSMHYLVGSLILLFVILPLSLALMEKLYFSLYPEPAEWDEEEAGPQAQPGPAGQESPAKPVRDDARIQTVNSERPLFG